MSTRAGATLGAGLAGSLDSTVNRRPSYAEKLRDLASRVLAGTVQLHEVLLLRGGELGLAAAELAHVAPLTFHPEAVVRHEARPAQTLARAALESASQAVWVMASRDPREVLRRHLSLVLADWEEQRKAEVDPERKAGLKQKRLDLLDVLKSHGVKVDEPSYLSLVTAAANEVRTKLPNDDLGDSAQVERLWRASAGSGARQDVAVHRAAGFR